MRGTGLAAAMVSVSALILSACVETASFTAPPLELRTSSCVAGVQLSAPQASPLNGATILGTYAAPPGAVPDLTTNADGCGCGGGGPNGMSASTTSMGYCGYDCFMTDYTGDYCNGEECRNGGWIGNLNCDPHDCRNRIGNYDYEDCLDDEGGGSGGGGSPPASDSVSYEQMVSATEELTQAMDEMMRLWDGDVLATMSNSSAQHQTSASSSTVPLPWETLVDVFVLANDIYELVVAGPNATNVTLVLADLGATFTPYVPSAGTVRILGNGAKASKAQYDRLKALAASARVGVARHSAFSAAQRAAGQVGAKRIVQIKNGSPAIGYIDGANISKIGDNWTFEIIELKPLNPDAITLGNLQLLRYEAGLRTMTSFTHNGVVHNLTDPRWTFVRRLVTYQ
jgi:hypothetical protein